MPEPLLQRRSIRLKGYDYSQPGAYFVTISTWKFQELFGHVIEGVMHPNPLGSQAQNEWNRLPARFSNIKLDAFNLMPNHIHGIVFILCADEINPDGSNPEDNNTQADSLASIVGSYKREVTVRVNTLRKTPSAPVWHRNYYEHIVRNQADLERIQEYIMNNPLRWELDRFWHK